MHGSWGKPSDVVRTNESQICRVWDKGANHGWIRKAPRQSYDVGHLAGYSSLSVAGSTL